jgi:acyl homoserine lactone synthase
MQVVSGTAMGLPAGLYPQVASYRHEVFVRRLGWQLATPEGIELDQFDRPDTVYIVARGDDGAISGCGRLLPTTQPYLLGDIFPQLLHGATPPFSPEIWELSRFCAVDLQERANSAMGQFSSPVAVMLLNAALRCAASEGAQRLITVSPLGVERLLRRAGFHAHRAAPPIIVDGHPLFACYIEVERCRDNA